jgi:hypothetical protein
MTYQVSDALTVTSKVAVRSLKVAFGIKKPVFIWGPPGIGKSDVVAQVTEELGGHLIDIRLSQMTPEDLRGMPYYNRESNKMEWAPSVELPTEELAAQYPMITLFLDEMNSAAPAVLAAAYQLTLNRRIGTYRLPHNVRVVAAGNRESDKGVTFRMPMPLNNRFTHLEMYPDFESWQSWAVANSVHSDVVGYLNFAKGDLYDFDPRSSSRAFATPRSWVTVSEFIKTESDSESLNALIAGTVGEGLAVKFIAHRKNSANLPDPLHVLDGTVTELKTKEISAMYSLATALCYELKAASDRKVKSADFIKLQNNFIAFMMQSFETEITMMALRLAMREYNIEFQFHKLSNFNEFHKKFGTLITAAQGR